MFSLRRTQRLRASEFQSVFQQRGRRVERGGFVALWQPRGGQGKVGFAVGRRIGGAVQRNRARRRMREAYRRAGAARASGVDLVFVARTAVLTCAFADLIREMEHAMREVARTACTAAREGTKRAGSG